MGLFKHKVKKKQNKKQRNERRKDLFYLVEDLVAWLMFSSQSLAGLLLKHTLPHPNMDSSCWSKGTPKLRVAPKPTDRLHNQSAVSTSVFSLGRWPKWRAGCGWRPEEPSIPFTVPVQYQTTTASTTTTPLGRRAGGLALLILSVVALCV